jgi:hypothetical protein
MRKWAFILFISMLISASCSSILNPKPSGTLSEKQMTDILVDIHLTEASMSIANDSISRLHDTTQMRIRFAQVFEKHNTDPDDFNTSLTYYLEHIEELDKIYVGVINRLTELEATLQPKVAQNTNRLSPDQKRELYKNIWYRSMNKNEAHVKIEYFSPLKYRTPSDKKIHYPEPLK